MSILSLCWFLSVVLSVVGKRTHCNGEHMNSSYWPVWALVPLVWLAIFVVYLFLRRGTGTKEGISAPLPTVTSSPRRVAEDPAVLASLRQNLRLKVGYNEEIIDRLIELERERMPRASLRALMEAAIERWERDNR